MDCSGQDSPGPENAEQDDSDAVVIPITDVLDLHSFPPEEIGELVADYLDEARRLGFRELRIIHGRGIGVQRRQVRAILNRHPGVSDFADAPSGAGGWGATVVRLHDTGHD